MMIGVAPKLVAALLATSLVLGACGGDDDDSSSPRSSTSTSTPSTTAAGIGPDLARFCEIQEELAAILSDVNTSDPVALQEAAASDEYQALVTETLLVVPTEISDDVSILGVSLQAFVESGDYDALLEALATPAQTQAQERVQVFGDDHCPQGDG